MASPSFKFGFEIEMLVKPKPHVATRLELEQDAKKKLKNAAAIRKRNRDRIISFLENELRKISGIRVAGEQLEGENFRDLRLSWGVLGDQSLDVAEGNGYCRHSQETPRYPPKSTLISFVHQMISRRLKIADGLEIVSETLLFKDPWKWKINSVWRTVFGNFDLKRSSHCGTHVHTSMVDSKWDTQTVASVCKGVLIFSPVFDSLKPFQDRSREHCQNNYNANRELADRFRRAQNRSAPQIFTKFIDQHINLLELVEAFSPKRSVAWNLQNLLPGGKHTIEHRLPPQVFTAEQTWQWIIFTVAFINFCLDADFSKFENGWPDVQKLYEKLTSAMHESVRNLHCRTLMNLGSSPPPFKVSDFQMFPLN